MPPLLPGGPAPMGMAPKMQLPKSPLGGPTGPGTSPAMSPGAGAGHEAAATADIKAVIPVLMKALNAFPVGDKRRQALMQSVLRLEANFGKSETDDLTAAAGDRIAAGAKSGMGLPGRSPGPPGMMLGGPSPMPLGGGGGMGGGMGGMGGGM